MLLQDPEKGVVGSQHPVVVVAVAEDAQSILRDLPVCKRAA